MDFFYNDLIGSYYDSLLDTELLLILDEPNASPYCQKIALPTLRNLATLVCRIGSSAGVLDLSVINASVGCQSSFNCQYETVLNVVNVRQ